MGGYGNSPLEIMACNAMLQENAFLQNFTYSCQWVTGTATALGASGTTENTININSDSDFVVQRAHFVALTALGTFLAVPDYTINVVISGSGRQIMNQAQPIANWLGSWNSNQVPNSMNMPLLISANSSISITLVNRTATAANFACLSLLGFKVFYQGQGNRTQIFHAL